VAENDDQSAPGYRLPAGLAQRQALREQIKKGLAQIQADGRSHYHPVEPEARRMKVGQNNRYAYNAQAIADEKEGIIVACDTTRQETDNGQLVPMIQQARKNLGGDNGLNVLAPPLEGKPAHGRPYAAQHFRYDPRSHTVTCPQNRLLDHEGHTLRKGQQVERFRCHHRDCPVRDQCTGDAKGRQIEVWPHQHQVQLMRQRLQRQMPQWRRRCEIIEPRFAQIKQHDGFRRWTVWGLEAVRTQWSLLCTTLNLRVLYRKWKSGSVPWPEKVKLALIAWKSWLSLIHFNLRWLHLAKPMVRHSL
jgi:hypothetical protein